MDRADRQVGRSAAIATGHPQPKQEGDHVLMVGVDNRVNTNSNPSQLRRHACQEPGKAGGSLSGHYRRHRHRRRRTRAPYLRFVIAGNLYTFAHHPSFPLLAAASRLPRLLVHLVLFAMLAGVIQYAYRESGLRSVRFTGRDAWLIIFDRACRMFAFGFVSLVLALFFSALEFSDVQIGLFMSLTLAGDIIMSLLLSFTADGIGRRRTLFGGSVLMIVSGSIFATCENFWLLLAAAILGIISATGSDFGPFRAIEEAILSDLTTSDSRADVLVWYITTSSMGSALGSELSGRFVDLMRSHGWELVEAYHACFWVYCVMGVVNMISVLLMSDKCELKPAPSPDKTIELEGLLDETDNDDDNDAPGPATELPEPVTEEATAKKSRLARISAETRKIMYILWSLFMVDTLADGMVSMSLTSYYMDQKFHMSKSSLGDIFSIAYFLSAVISIFASPLARHIGLVNTMVFTHIPSSTAVLIFPVPQSVLPTYILLLVRVGLNNLDQAPRAALIAAVVKPEERTAVMGITSMLRTLSGTLGPTVTGFLAGNDFFWIAFVAAGLLRLAYDIGLFVMCINMTLYKHEPPAARNPSGAAP